MNAKTAQDVCVEPVSREQWLTLAGGFRDYNYRQIWDYGLALARRRGARCQHVTVKYGGDVIALADVRIKQVPVVGGGVAYISGGPLTRRDETGVDGLKRALPGLMEEYGRRRGLVLRILAPLGDAAWNAAAAGVFESLGFRPTKRSAAYRTLVVDIARPVNEIRAGLAQKWRNCLNAAERQGLRTHTAQDDETFGRFCALFNDFNRRKGFHVDLDADFYRELQPQLAERDRLTISLVESDGKTIAGHVSSLLDDTCVYLLGATNEEGLKVKAAYLLQWQAMLRARERGLMYYDLGGIDPEGNPGVYHFKAGMGGVDVQCAGPYEYVCPTWKTSLASGAERMYRLLKRSPIPKA